MSSSTPSKATVIPSSNQSAIHAFSTRLSAAPTPQPGKYPVVFSTGPGAPINAANFQPDPATIKAVLSDFPEQYAENPRFREFRTLTGLSELEFRKRLHGVTLLGLAQQLVHAHTNLNLPQGDFSPVASTDFVLPSAVASYVQQFGELSVDTLGTRFLLTNYTTTIKSLVFRAKRILTVCETQADIEDEVSNLWLPMSSNDSRTAWTIAVALNRWLLQKYKIWIKCEKLMQLLFKGEGVPQLLVSLRDSLADPEYPEPEEDSDGDVAQPEAEAALPAVVQPYPQYSHSRRFDFLFDVHGDANEWARSFGDPSRQRTLNEIGLHWNNPAAGDLNFDYQPKRDFSDLLLPWMDMRSSLLKFISCSAIIASRSVACGSLSQLSELREDNGTTTVASLIAVLAPEYSLSTCFPPKALVCPRYEYHAKVTTTVRLNDRAAEFVQKDWST